MDRYVVVSSDCHAGLPPKQYRDYLDPKYHEVFDREFAAQHQAAQEMSKTLFVDDFNLPWRRKNADGLLGAWDHSKRLEVLDADGIAAEVIFPDGITELNSPPFGAGLGLSTVGVEPEMQWAGARAHNRWLAEFCQMAPARRIGVAIVPALWDVDAAVEEVIWARKNGLGGLMLPVVWGTCPAYHLRQYDRLWAKCAELGMIVHFHAGAAPMQDYFVPEPSGAFPEGAVGLYAAEVAWWLARPVSFMIGSGVFERHPNLKLALTEGACFWVPPYLAQLDHGFGAHRAQAQLGDFTTHLSLKPSEYFHRNVRLGASCFTRREAEGRETIGVESIMWGSDYPHPEGAWPDTLEQMEEVFVGLPENEIAEMLGGNAIEFYGLDPAPLREIANRIGPPTSLFENTGKPLPSS
jgi:predicted TIM-barrel fold metal-dependent hydrolase